MSTTSPIRKEEDLQRFRNYYLEKGKMRNYLLIVVGLNTALRIGYHAWKQGVPPAMLMMIYNHSSYQITKRYLGIIQEEKDDVFYHVQL